MLISGIIFIILTLTGVRERLLNAIPRDLKNAISIGIGLFICAIGLENSGISLYGAFGSFTSPMALMTIFGLLLIVVLTIIRFRYAIFVSLITVTLLVILIVYTNPNYASKLGVSNTFSFTFDYQIFGKFTEGFGHFFGKNGPTATQDLPAQITLFALLLLSIILVNIFDTIGALIGVIKHGNFFDQNGRALGVKKALLSDAIGTTLGGVFGYTPVTTFIESNVGVAAGARTGLAAVVTGIMFLIFIPLAPLTNLISPAATAPVMIVIGASMMRYVVDID
jgi:AGZA family xanthine/uracil permease-like MFS transporter